jgi:hypothetical protein
MLTFDDGPHATLTPLLLDILKAKKVRGSLSDRGILQPVDIFIVTMYPLCVVIRCARLFSCWGRKP